MATFETIIRLFQSTGVLDFLLPFLLVFTISYAILRKSKILGDRNSFDVVISIILGLLFVVPHITGGYPTGYDPVIIIQQALPSVSLVAIAAIMLLITLGIFGKGFADNATPWIGFASLGFIIYIFGAALGFWVGPYNVLSWWTTETTEILIIIAVFGLVVWFITRDPTPAKNENGFNFLKYLNGFFGDVNSGKKQ